VILRDQLAPEGLGEDRLVETIEQAAGGSFGRWLWWQERGDVLWSVRFDWMEMRALMERGPELGVQVRGGSTAWITVGMPISGRPRTGEEDLCKILSRLVDREDDFIATHTSAEFTLPNRLPPPEDLHWLSCLDWFRIYRPDFNFWKLDYPRPGVALIWERQSAGLTAFDGGYGVAVAYSDVERVTGTGDFWSIYLASGPLIRLHWRDGLLVGEG
jgi:hypothetical protein